MPDTSRARVTYRGLRWTDFESLVATYYELYDERERGEPIGIHLFATPPSREDEVTWFGGLYRRVLAGETVVLVADRDGTAVGSCTVGPAGPTRSSEIGHVGVLGILVNRQHRGQGIGEGLMRAMVEACRGQFEQIRLSVFANNAGAKRLYERLGFVPCGALPDSIKRNGQYVDEEIMVLDLRANTVRKPPANR